MGLNLNWVEFGVHSTSVYVILEPKMDTQPAYLPSNIMYKGISKSFLNTQSPNIEIWCM